MNSTGQKGEIQLIFKYVVTPLKHKYQLELRVEIDVKEKSRMTTDRFSQRKPQNLTLICFVYFENG